MFRVIFYRNENGVEFVRDWLKYELPVADRQIIGENLATLQEGFPMIGMPLVKPMGDGIFELRSHITDKRIARILFFHATEGLVLLHGFIKKTESTRLQDLRLAKTRKNNFLNAEKQQ
jgi:phage-related protein